MKLGFICPVIIMVAAISCNPLHQKNNKIKEEVKIGITRYILNKRNTVGGINNDLTLKMIINNNHEFKNKIEEAINGIGISEKDIMEDEDLVKPGGNYLNDAEKKFPEGFYGNMIDFLTKIKNQSDSAIVESHYALDKLYGNPNTIGSANQKLFDLTLHQYAREYWKQNMTIMDETINRIKEIDATTQ